MQKISIGMALGPPGSGLVGFPIPQRQSDEEEQRLVQWLNDEWIDPGPQFERWKRGHGAAPAMPSDEDVPARKTILAEFLPRLRKVQKMPDSLAEAGEMGRFAMKKYPGKYASEEEAAMEESGIADYGRLVRMLNKHSIVPMIPTQKQPIRLLAKGKNMTKIWAMHTLLQMASCGTLERLAECKCGCGKWIIRKRVIDKFFGDHRVKFHQSDPSVKEERRKKARERYHQGQKGVVETGWRNKRKAAKHGKT
jgi:hypothetical protein